MKSLNYIIFGLLISLLWACNGKENKSNANHSKEADVSLTPVRVQIMKAQDFNHYVNLTGYLEAEDYAYISPEAPGQIKKINVKEGRFVTKGTSLIELNTSVVNSQIKQLETQLDLARQTFEKQADLWHQKIGSEMQYLQAKTQKESLESQLALLQSQKEMSIIRAPFDGTVDKINFKVGEMASPGGRLIEFVNLNKMKIKSEASERLLPVIQKGSPVSISFPTYPEKHITAPIYRTSNIINPANRTFGLEIKIDNTQQELKPNMLAHLKVNDLHIENALQVPSIIIKNDFDQSFVYVVENRGKHNVAIKKYVETGVSYNDQTQITKGLSVGDRVILEGYNTVSNGSEVKILK